MFCEDQVRATGRDTSGVRGITMKGGTEVLGMEITNGSGELFVVTSTVTESAPRSPSIRSRTAAARASTRFR